MGNKLQIRIYTDGGSRGNPGPSAIGVVIELGGEKKEYSEFIGEATNNEAEYKAVIFALKKVKQLIGKEKTSQLIIEIYIDSELLAKQLNNEYKVKDEKIQPLFLEVWNLKFDFDKLVFKYISREKNKRADYLLNQTLDRELNGKLKL